jgi:hypothetical protein
VCIGCALDETSGKSLCKEYGCQRKSRCKGYAKKGAIMSVMIDDPSPKATTPK